MVLRIVLAACSIIFLSACSSGGDVSNFEDVNNSDIKTDGATGKVSVAITDDLTKNYSEVWVSLLKLEAVAADGGVVSLFESDRGYVVNLAEFDGVGSLLDVRDVPVGIYQTFLISLSKRLYLVDRSGNTRGHDFAQGNGDKALTVTVKGSLEVMENEVTAFGLDFDLKRFVFDNAGKIVPAIEFITQPSQTLRQTIAHLSGDIAALDTDGFTLRTKDHVDVKVNLNAATAIVFEDGIALDQLEVGMPVTAYGSYDATLVSVEAIRVVQQAATDSAVPGQVELEGRITALVEGGFTLDIKQANYLPEQNIGTVLITELTRFIRGQSSQLAAGQCVHIQAVPNDDGSLSALVMDIEGAGAGSDAAYDFGEVHGEIVGLIGENLTVRVISDSGMSLEPGSEFTVNIADVYIKYGAVAALSAGVPVTIKGVVISGMLYPRLMEVLKHAKQVVNVEGLVLGISGTLLTVKVTQSDNPVIGSLDELVFDIGNAAVSGGMLSDLILGSVPIAVRGILDDANRLIPSEIIIKLSTTPPVCVGDITITGVVSAITATSMGVEILTQGPAGPVTIGWDLIITPETVFVDGVQPAVGQSVEVLLEDCIDSQRAIMVSVLP